MNGFYINIYAWRPRILGKFPFIGNYLKCRQPSHTTTITNS